jgi:hypothetical protein
MSLMHVMGRFKERYGIDLTRADIDSIKEQIEAGAKQTGLNAYRVTVRDKEMIVAAVKSNKEGVGYHLKTVLFPEGRK